jgi:hypothetical protein
MSKLIGFVVVLGFMSLSSWLISRKSKRILGQALGRDIRDGEETSLRAWMAVPDGQLHAAAKEMARPSTVDVTLDAMDTAGRAVHPFHARRADQHEPYSKPNSIR